MADACHPDGKLLRASYGTVAAAVLVGIWRGWLPPGLFTDTAGLAAAGLAREASPTAAAPGDHAGQSLIAQAAGLPGDLWMGWHQLDTWLPVAVRVAAEGISVMGARTPLCNGVYYEHRQTGCSPEYMSPHCTIFSWEGTWYMAEGTPGMKAAESACGYPPPPSIGARGLDFDQSCEVSAPAALPAAGGAGAPPSLGLLGGGRMPLAGLGLTGRDSRLTEQQVFDFLMLGGRHLDGALAYMNTREMGRGVRRAVSCGVPREEIFVTSKILPHHFLNAVEVVRYMILASAGLDYIDLILLHFPTSHTTHEMQFEGKDSFNHCKDRHGSWPACWRETWRMLDYCRRQGWVRHLGVSNCGPGQIRVLQELGLAPVEVNQLEYHPWSPTVNRQAVEWCHSQAIAVTAFCSVEVALGMSPGFNVFGRTWALRNGSAGGHGDLAAALHGIARPYGRTVGQVLLRWAVQHNVSVIPGTINPQHMLQNLQIFDWALSPDDMATLDAMPATWGTSTRYPHADFTEGL